MMRCLLLYPLLLGFLRSTTRNNINNKSAFRRLPPRGGSFGAARSSSSSLIEFNPNYQDEPPPHNGIYVIIEAKQADKPIVLTIDAVAIVRVLTVPVIFSRYVAPLQRSNPDLFAVSVACLFIFLLWQIPACRGFLERHFVCQRARPSPGLLLSNISHIHLLHLALNLNGLLVLGPPVQRVLSHYSPNYHVNLWLLMIGAALSSSATFLALDRDGKGAIGLSGVTMALLAVYAKMFPKSRLEVQLVGIIPVGVLPAYRLLHVVLLWSFLGSVDALSQRPQLISHAGHLGGLLFGMLFYELWSRH